MSEIPSGTVTFVFTDIENSTQLWERDPQRMQAAFDRQEAIIRQAAAEQQGYVYKMVGDSFQIAFETASGALQAALEAQQKLQLEPWGDMPLKVRMALHTGVTEEREDDYVGPILNRVARLLGVGYGGQVLLTQVTSELVRDGLPPGVSLRDLGEHRLKDLVRPEHIFQLVAPGLQSSFLPIKTLDTFPNNLPVRLTSFVGREKEIAQIKLLVVSGSSSPVYTGFSSGQARLVTLTGPGGTGKTRLALQAAADLLELFPDGVWLVELAPLADPELIWLTVAGVLGLRVTGGKPAEEVLVDYLRPRELMLILDNCEHLIDAAAQLADRLLTGCPELHILATSREILGISGEAPFRVPSLSVPNLRYLPPAFGDKDLEGLLGYEAVRLFCDRAATTDPRFRLSSANAAAVIQICQRLDGIPLALELAAARVRMLSVEQIAARLDDSFRLLTGGSRTVLPRHQALRALIDWSYNLLSPDECSVLQRLSVFSGGWTLEAAEAVLPDQPGSLDIFDLLAQLVDKSLVLADQEKDSETRYRLLETIRQYAGEKLSNTGGIEAVRSRHLAYYAQLVNQASPHLRSSLQVQWLDRLEAELDNLRTALEWARDHHIETGLSMAADLFWFWHIRGCGSEGVEWIEKLLAKESALRRGEPILPDLQLARARALNTAGFIIFYQGDYERSRALFGEAQPLLEALGQAGRHERAAAQVALGMMNPDPDEAMAMEKESLEVFRAEGDLFFQAECLQGLGFLSVNRGDLEAARAYMQEDLALRRQINDLDGMGTALIELGNIAFIEGNSTQADAQFVDALECFRKVGNLRFVSQALFSQAMMAFAMGDFDLATEKCEEAIAIGHELRENTIVAIGLFRLGRVSWAQGDFDLAVRRYQEVLTVAEEVNFKPLVAIGHFGLGVVSISKGNHDEAYAHLKESTSLWRELNDDLDFGFSLTMLAELSFGWEQWETAAKIYGVIERSLPEYIFKFLAPVERQVYDRNRQRLQDALGVEAFQRAWSEGQAMSMDQALDVALSLSSQASLQPVGLRLEGIELSQVASTSPRSGRTGLVEPLSGRELEVVGLLAEGLTNAEIAQKLYIDIGTVKSHNTHIFAKLNVKNRLQAVAKAKRMGLT